MTTESGESDDGFEAVCSVDDVPDVMPRRIEVDGRGILLCRSGGEIFAVDEICPHEKKSMRYGVIQRGRIVCPHHRYKFDLDSGRCDRRCPPVDIYEVKIEEETVYLRVAGRTD